MWVCVRLLQPVSHEASQLATLDLQHILSCVLLTLKQLTLWLYVNKIFLCSPNIRAIRGDPLPLLPYWPLTFACPPQIYAQKESQRTGYIELALQAHEQMTTESTAAWLTRRNKQIHPHWGNPRSRQGVLTAFCYCVAQAEDQNELLGWKEKTFTWQEGKTNTVWHLSM